MNQRIDWRHAPKRGATLSDQQAAEQTFERVRTELLDATRPVVSDDLYRVLITIVRELRPNAEVAPSWTQAAKSAGILQASLASRFFRAGRSPGRILRAIKLLATTRVRKALPDLSLAAFSTLLGESSPQAMTRRVRTTCTELKLDADAVRCGDDATAEWLLAYIRRQLDHDSLRLPLPRANERPITRRRKIEAQAERVVALERRLNTARRVLERLKRQYADTLPTTDARMAS